MLDQAAAHLGKVAPSSAIWLYSHDVHEQVLVQISFLPSQLFFHSSLFSSQRPFSKNDLWLQSICRPEHSMLLQVVQPALTRFRTSAISAATSFMPGTTVGAG
jgi:hypothetical protein